MTGLPIAKNAHDEITEIPARMAYRMAPERLRLEFFGCYVMILHFLLVGDRLNHNLPM